MLPRGTRLGSYRLLRELRDGWHGTAFLAVKPGIDGFEKRVVLYCAGRAQLSALANEAIPAARLAHGGIAHILDVGVDGEISYVASEHVVGTTLRAALLRHGRLPWRGVVRAVSQAARALAHAHGQRGDDGRLLGIVHRRVSPGRITIEPSGNTRITGLGVSWAWPDHLGFGAPEEMRGEPVDGRADVFALGMVLRRCVDERELPDALRGIIAGATHPLPEYRCTAARMHDELSATLRDSELVAAE